MGKIITLKDKITRKSIYPITVLDAITSSDGSTITKLLDDKFNELSQVTDNAITQAKAASEMISSLKNLTSEDSNKIAEEINNLNAKISDSIILLNSVIENYEYLEEKANNILKSSDLISTVTKESTKVPTTSAVSNYVEEKRDELLNYLIDTTSVIPNYIPKTSGQILINTEDNIIYLSPTGSNTWYGVNATPLRLEEGNIAGGVVGTTLDIKGDVVIENNTTLVINNEVEIEGTTLVIPAEQTTKISNNTLEIENISNSSIDGETLDMNDSASVSGNTLSL